MGGDRGLIQSAKEREKILDFSLPHTFTQLTALPGKKPRSRKGALAGGGNGCTMNQSNFISSNFFIKLL